MERKEDGIRCFGGPLHGQLFPLEADGTAKESVGYIHQDQNGKLVGKAPSGFYDLARDGYGERRYLWRDADSDPGA